MTETSPTVELPQLLTSTEAARHLRISARTLWEITEPRGELPAVRLAGRVRYDVRDVAAFIAASKEPAGRQRPYVKVQRGR